MHCILIGLIVNPAYLPMPEIDVTDTHPLLWFLANSSRLSESSRQLFRDEQEGKVNYVPAIVVAELIWVVRAGRVKTDLSRILEVVKAHYTVSPFTLDDAVELASMSDSLTIHDSMIVWEAKKLNATLITRDEAIQAANVVPTVW